jgi:hypothetical protein
MGVNAYDVRGAFQRTPPQQSRAFQIFQVAAMDLATLRAPAVITTIRTPLNLRALIGSSSIDPGPIEREQLPAVRATSGTTTLTMAERTSTMQQMTARIQQMTNLVTGLRQTQHQMAYSALQKVY